MDSPYPKTPEKTHYMPYFAKKINIKTFIMPPGGHFKFMQIMQIAQSCQRDNIAHLRRVPIDYKKSLNSCYLKFLGSEKSDSTSPAVKGLNVCEDEHWT